MYRFKKGWLSGIPVALLLILATTSLAFGQSSLVRWDILSRNFAVVPNEDSAGGVAAALASDGSLILLTGHGTFVTDTGAPHDATGGGTWATFGPVGSASGTYRVTEALKFDPAGAGTVTTIDLIGNPANRSAGLAVLRIRYSDGTRGILVVSCHLPGTPDSLFEGITATKGFVDFFERVHDVPGVNANRTIFHVQQSDFGFSALIAADATAKGHFTCLRAGNADILGLHLMAAQGKVTHGAMDGSSFAGTATLKVLKAFVPGSPSIFRDVPYTVRIAPGGPGTGKLGLTVKGVFDGVAGDVQTGNGEYDLALETLISGRITVH